MLDDNDWSFEGWTPEEIERFLAPLDVLERNVFMRRYGLDGGGLRTEVEIGIHFNLTKVRVEEILDRADQKLRGVT